MVFVPIWFLHKWLTTKFVNDGGYVVGEETGDSLVRCLYGRELISINNNGTLGYYHTDEHGNVAYVTDIERYKNIVANYDYDAFGNETVSTESYYNPMKYCGEYYDSETGLIYLRARYYDPSVGRFVSEDQHWNLDNMIYGDKEYKDREIKVPDIQAVAQAGNLYVYGLNNPVMYVDYDGGRVYVLGISASASIGFNVQPEVYLAYDDKGNVGLIWSKGFGGSVPGASFTGTTGIINVDTIYDMEDSLISATTMVGEAVVGGGTAVISPEGQVGTTVSLGVGVGLPISQSVNASETSVFGFNLVGTAKSAWNKVKEFFSR